MTRLYQIYDKVSQEMIGNILRYRIDAPAVRVFHDWLRSETGPGGHAVDFDLLYLGEQDGSVGMITAVIPVAVALGSQWLEMQSPRLVADTGTEGK